MITFNHKILSSWLIFTNFLDIDQPDLMEHYIFKEDKYVFCEIVEMERFQRGRVLYYSRGAARWRCRRPKHKLTIKACLSSVQLP